MKKVLVVAVVVAALVWVVVSQGRYGWHQKLTVTVETPAGEVSESSVSAVSWRKQWVQWDGMGWSYELTGEAVVVEVTPGRFLFALLKGRGRRSTWGRSLRRRFPGARGGCLTRRCLPRCRASAAGRRG